MKSFTPLTYELPQPSNDEMLVYSTLLHSRLMRVKVRIYANRTWPGRWDAEMTVYRLFCIPYHRASLGSVSYPGILKMVEDHIQMYVKHREHRG